MKKLLLKFVVFCSIFLFLFSNIWNVFSYKDTLDSHFWSTKHFYESAKNTIDVIFYGNSQSNCNVNTSILWEKYGIASFLFGGAGRGISTIYYSIEESLKTQTPKLLVVEITPAIYDLYYNPKALYRNTITFKYSSTFVDNILSFVPDNKLVDVLLKFPIFHSKYTDLTSMDFQDTLYFNRGFDGRMLIAEFDTLYNIPTDKIIPISEECENYLEKIILLSQEKNIPLLLFAAPANISTDKKAMQNSISIIAEKYNVPYINFNSSEFDININYGMDFDSENHLNFYGAKKND